MMGTRAAAFAGKISNLRESLLRIQNGTLPQPTCIDLANMMKYFCQVFHDFRDFKDIENVPLYAHEKRDRSQLIKTLPSFDYCGLYKSLAQLVDILPLIPQSSNGLDQLGLNLLMVFKCLVPFLDQENMETMPYLVTSLFMSLPSSLHKDILDTLCFNLLPFTIDEQQRGSHNGLKDTTKFKCLKYNSRVSKHKQSGSKRSIKHCVVRIEDLDSQEMKTDDKSNEVDESQEDLGFKSGDDDECSENEEYAMLSITSILMIAFHYIPEPMHHSQLVECIMKLKSNVFEDLLYVIAYGTTRARCPAVEILFRYWPDVCPNPQDKKNHNQAGKLKHVCWQPTKCQNKHCNFTRLGDDDAVKMCLDFKISITLSGLPPPMLVCLDCVDSIYKQQISANRNTSAEGISEDTIYNMDDYSSKFIDILLPMDRISKSCESKKCMSSERTAIGTCFDIECANYNCKKPIRYCKTCFDQTHDPCEANNYDVTLQNHIRHSSLNLNVMESEESITNFTEAIISLLKEAAPADRLTKDSERYLRSLTSPTSQFSSDNKDMNIATEEKQLISQYGIWLMTGLCKPVDKLSDDLLGRLLGMLFQWFHFTACLPDDQAGSALEKLKGECIKGWIMEVKNQRLDVFISCLLPHPIDCSKVGGHWEVWPDSAHQIKEGFKRLLCLVPYDIITDDVWDEIMPYWMECFRHEVPENELNELKILLSKVFDPELSPLGFETKQMYNFISSRFEDPSNTNQEQTLYWLQIITMLEIPIPIDFLFKMLNSGVKSLAIIRANELKRLKIAGRLEDLNRSTQDRGDLYSTQESSRGCLTDDELNEKANESSSSSSSNGETFSAPDDDVLLPEDQIQSATSDNSFGLEQLSQQERQARARAAFSAKLLQHATILDSQCMASTSGSGPVSSSSAMTSLLQQQVSTEQGSSSKIKRINLAPTPDARSDPQNSANSSQSSLGRLERKVGTSSSRRKDDKKKKKKPKLQLQLNSTDESSSNKIDNNLICYILMMDILLKQLDLQEINSHRGLDGKEAQKAIDLLNEIVATPWLGKHTCAEILPLSSVQSDKKQSESTGNQDLNALNEFPETSSSIHAFSHCVQGYEHEDSFETCIFCEIISTFHQLAMFLIEFFSPIIEVSICEVSQDVANGEFEGKPDYSRIGLDQLEPDPKTNRAQFDFSHAQSSQQDPTYPTQPSSPNYMSPSLKPEVLNSLPKELQLTYNLLVQFHLYQTPDIVSQLLQMIKLISLHSQVLSKAVKTSPQFIIWCQHNMLINKLWTLCQLESSEIARTCVPLLLHCITLPWGVRLFRDLVERDFNSENWLNRFKAVERVVTIAYYCEPSTIKNSTLLQSTMASAFCYVVRCLDDIEAIVAQHALVSLEMMKTSSLKLLLWCLEVQFDFITIDRPIILRSVFQLYNHLRDRRFLTWEFFLNRFDTIFLEAQIYLQQTGEIPSFTMQDLKNTNTKSEIYQKKILRAKEALHGTHHSRSLSPRFTKSCPNQTKFEEASEQYRHSLKLQLSIDGPGSTDHSNTTFQNQSMKDENRKSISPLRRVMQHGHSTSSRYQSVALLTSQSMVNRKNSKFMINLAMQSAPPLMLPDKLHQHLPNSFVDDGSKLNEIAQENHVFGVVHRVCDEDRDTNHSLIFLLMQFFSKPDPSHPQTVKTLNRNHQTVLRHLNILMGYSVARKNFLIPATNLRLLPVFNAFLTSLPKVLDFNYSLGTILLDTCLPILIHCPSPDEVQYDSNKTPTYSLWLLNPLMRQSWLSAVMAFLYKYQFNQAHLKDHVYKLMWIVINTLESHLNQVTSDLPLDRVVNATRIESSSLPQQSTSQPQKDQEDGSAKTATTSRISHPASEGQQVTPIGSPVIVESQQGKASVRLGIQGSELVEMQPKRAAGSDQSSSQHVKIDMTVTAPTKGSKNHLVKAETSDSLNVKAKVFQKRVDIPKDDLRSKKKGTSSSSTRIDMEPIEVQNQPISTLKLGSEQQIYSSDERLLPVGGQHKLSKTSTDSPVAERLLPIGNNQTSTVKLGSIQHTHLKGLRPSPKEILGENKVAASQYEKPTPSYSIHRDHDTRTKHPNKGLNQEQAVETLNEPKANKKRFGVKSSQSDASSAIKQSQKEPQDLVANDSLPPSGKTSGFGVGRRTKLVGKFGKDYTPKGPSVVKPSFSTHSLLNEHLAQINRHSCVQEFSDKDLSMCLVILETFIHHEPSMAAQMLPNILRLVARYSSSSADSWQSGSNMHLVGGSMFVARQFIRVALHDLMDNNIFHQIFTSHFTGFEFYKSMATALADFTDLNQLAPLSRLFEDLNRQKNLPQASTLMTLLENVATYFECIISESTNHSLTIWTNFITNWENFLRKLILNLPRFSGSSVVNSSAGNHVDVNLPIAYSTSPVINGSAGNAGSSSSAGQFLSTKSSGNQEGTNSNSASAIPSSCSMIMAPIMRIILSTSKISHLASCKTIVDPYSKIISYTVLNSQFKYEQLLEINHNCCRLYTRDREKYLIQRTIAYELIQVLKFRFFILEENLLLLLLFILQDVGGALAPRVVRDNLKLDQSVLNQAESYITNISECLRQYSGDLQEFITDVHAISRINDNLVGSQPSSINRDSFGGHVKAAISQYLALDMSFTNGTENKSVLRYLPWLYTSPSVQQGPREFIDCVSHIRQLSWIILGSLQHSTLMKGNQISSNLITPPNQGSQVACQPIPIEKNSNVAEHVHVILAGFAEQSKESVLHMSGLFHAFLLCQLWTMYCENICGQHPPNSEQYQFCQSTLDDFWAKITPGVLRLVGHSRVMSEMVSTHFLQLIESLIESNSSVLIRVSRTFRGGQLNLPIY